MSGTGSSSRAGGATSRQDEDPLGGGDTTTEPHEAPHEHERAGAVEAEPDTDHGNNEVETAPSPRGSDRDGRFGRLAALGGGVVRKAGIAVGFLALLALFTALSPGFLTPTTLVNIAEQSAISALVGIGLTFVIIGGGIDLSVGSLLALCSVILADAMASGVPVLLALLLSAAVGLAAGSVNAALITKARLAPFIVTLGGLSFYRGLALLYTQGQPIYGLPSSFQSFFGGSFLGAPIPVWLALIVAAVAHITLWHTRWGRHLRASGGDAEAARLSGVHVSRIRAATYLVSGFCAFLAGLVFVARLGAAEPISGQGLELTAIATAAIGGASLAGGRGSIVGTVLGALIIGTLQAGLTILNVQAFWQQIAIGALIVVAVALDPNRRSEASP